MFLQFSSSQPAQAQQTSKLLALFYKQNVPAATPQSPLLKKLQICPWATNCTAKIKFKRKGGWIRTFNNWLVPYLYKFGYGHPTVQFGIGTYRHRYKRYLTQHCMLWTHPDALWPTHIYYTPQIKPFNKYTKRGIRASKFRLLKRKGKESKYTHLKSKIF